MVRPKNITIKFKMKALNPVGSSEPHNPSSAEDQGTKDSTLGWGEVVGGGCCGKGKGRGESVL